MSRSRHISPAFNLKRLIEGANARIRELEIKISREDANYAKFVNLCNTTHAKHPRVAALKANSLKNHRLRRMQLEAQIAEHREDIVQWSKQALAIQ